MFFHYLTVFALLATAWLQLAVADPVHLAPRADNSAESYLEQNFRLTSITTGKALTTLASALSKAESSMFARTDLQSAWSAVYATNGPAVAASISKSGWNFISTTAEPAWFTKVNKDAQKQILSEQSALEKIITSVVPVSTSSGGAAQETAALRFAGGVAAGLVGLVAAL